MKLLAHTLLMTLTAMAAPAVSYADCMGTPLNQRQLANVVRGNTVCGKPGLAYPGGASSSDRWQEQHRAATSSSLTGELWDYKLGASTMDPTKLVGGWVVSGPVTDATIVHTYGSASFSWKVYGPFPNVPGVSIYSFCTAGAEHVKAFVLIGPVGCAGIFP
ncbi:MAG: hypothetical protein IPF94_19885 [Betaproteobacteria bacterium]|nr:hypothetical protein [Betaproteobacteria bacterium]